jgi:hypothetical protein
VNVHGTCSLCGGAVCTPTSWLGVHHPTPTCQSCGAVKADAHGPVIPMRRAEPAPVTAPWFVPYDRPIWVDPNVWPYGIRYTTTTGTAAESATSAITSEQLSNWLATGNVEGAVSNTGCRPIRIGSVES